MKSTHLFKIAIAAVFLTLVNLILAYLMELPTISSVIIWSLTSNLMVVMVLFFYLQNCTLSTKMASFSIGAIYFVIGSLNILIEAYIFNVTDLAITTKDLSKSLVATIFFTPFFVWLFRNDWSAKQSFNFPKRTFIKWFGNILLSVFLYIIFYFAAGIILQASYPGLMDFYADKLPSPLVVLLTQVPRGLLFTSIAILIASSTRLSLLKASLLTGLIFSVLGGLAPLLDPNELMPVNIRLAHTFEVGISNFLYGFVITYYLVGNRKQTSQKEIHLV